MINKTDKIKSSEETIKTATLFLYQAYRDSGVSEGLSKEIVGKFIIEECVKQVDPTYLVLRKEEIQDTIQQLMNNVNLLLNSKQMYYNEIGREIAKYLYKLLEE